MKVLHKFLAIVTSISIVFILFISAFEIGAYGNFGWYEKTYSKYHVLDDLQMEMKDVMHVTREMMAYLRGNRSDLQVVTTVDGDEQEFFNVREEAHMMDVKNLFLGGLWIRRGAILALIIAMFFLFLTKAEWKKLLPKYFLIGTGGIIGIAAVAGLVFMSDFHKYFYLFHKVFFTNDLWLLDPDTDLLIRMLPEGFFFDMVIRIGIIFFILMSMVLVISVWLNKPKDIRKTNETI